MTHAFNSWMLTDEAAKSALYQILLYNSRALLLLACCFVFIRLFKVSASSRHFLISLAIGSIILIPVFSAFIPAVDIIINTHQPVFLEALKGAATATLETGYTRIVPSTHYATSLFLLYIIISILLILKIGLDNLKMLALLKLSRPVHQAYWKNALQQHCQDLGIKRNVTIVHSSLVTSPSTWGAIRPIIFIPNNAIQWPDHLITSTLLHELAHIKRFDWLVQQLAKCICAVYWVNPICWKAFKNLDSNAETACDDIAIVTGLHKTQYANDLLHVAEHVYQHANYNYAALNMATAHKTCQLSDRVLAILNPEARHTPMSKHNAFVIFFAIVCLFLPFASMRANFIERVHISLPAATAELFTIAPEVTPYSLVPENEKNRTSSTLTTVAINELPASVKAAPIKAQDNNTVVESEKPIVITHLQTISTSELIEKFAAEFIAKPIKRSSNQEKPKADPYISTHVKNEDLMAGIAPASRSLEVMEPPTNFFSAPSIPNFPIHEKAVVKNLAIPKYPRRALSRGIEGEVTVEYSLDEFGKVTSAKIVSTGVTKIFNRSALKALKKSTFSPRMLNGRPVVTRGLKEKYIFVLES